MVSADPADSGVVASPESDPSEGPCDAAVDPVDSGAAVATDCDSDSVSGACVDSVDPAASGAVDSCDSVAADGTPVDPVSTASGADSVVGALVSSDPAVLTEADCVVAESSASVGSGGVSVDEAVALADDDDPSDSVAAGSDVVNAPEGASVSEAPAPDSETDSEGAEDSVVAAGSAEGDASSSDVLVVLVSSCGVATVTTGSPLDSDSDSDPDPSISAEESVVSGADVDDGLEVLATVSSSSVEGAPVKGPPNSMVGLAVAGGCVWISKSIPSVPDCDCDSVEGDSGLLGDGDGDDSDPASGASVASTDT